MSVLLTTTWHIEVSINISVTNSTGGTLSCGAYCIIPTSDSDSTIYTNWEIEEGVTSRTEHTVAMVPKFLTCA